MIDPEDLRFVEVFVEDVVELAGRCQVAAERFLDDDPGVSAQPDLARCSATVPKRLGGIAR